MLKKIYSRLPPFLRLNLKCHFYNFVYLFRSEKENIPSMGDQLFIGGGDFEEIGKEFFAYFTKWGRIQNDYRVLDMGCGFGRMALPLISFLDKGSYEGFDVHKKGIEWCQKYISEKNPNFKFHFTDVYNVNYNPAGTLKANTFQFPYANEEFDFCFATSLFTHLKPPDARNYIKEMSRVLNSGGRCLITTFLINEDALLKIKAGAARYSFSLQSGGFYTSNKEFPEEAIAYSVDTITKYLEENGLAIDEKLYGFWSGIEDFTSFQDILIARKIKKS